MPESTTTHAEPNAFDIVTTAYSIERWQIERITEIARARRVPRSLVIREILNERLGSVTAPAQPIAA